MIGSRVIEKREPRLPRGKENDEESRLFSLFANELFHHYCTVFELQKYRILRPIDLASYIAISAFFSALTESRAQVLELIWQSHRPIGAYTILEMVSAVSAKRVAPPTVYRALEFLLEQGFIHQIKSLNAFLGCPTPHLPHNHQSYFLICKKCGNAMEFYDDNISQKIRKLAKGMGFLVKAESLEVTGICSACE